MNKKAEYINRILAITVILSLCIVFAQRTLRHHMGFVNSISNSIGNFINSGEAFSGRIYNFYMEMHGGIKGNVEWNYSYPPRVNDFEYLNYEYLRATRRGHFNRVTFLTDGRIMFDNLEPNLYLEERAESIAGFSNYLERNGIPFLFVRIPNKLQDSSVLPLAFSNNHIIENGYKLLELVGQRGVDTFDLRAEMMNDHIDFSTAFYRYHMHWTNETVLWASQAIGQLMNREYGFNIDLDIWNLDQYHQLLFKSTLHGNEATTIGRFRKLEDITLLTPIFPVDLEMSNSNTGFEVAASNNFVEMFYPRIYEGHTERFICNDIRLPGAHFTHIINHAATENKRVMLISDSFSLSWAMYLPLGFSHLDFVYLINQRTAEEIWGFLDGKEYDLIILAASDVIISTETASVFEDDRLYLGIPPN